MIAAREVDRIEQTLVSNGEASFQVPCTGHEGSAILSPFLKPEDWLHLHYRDKALMLARGVSPEMFFNSLFCNAESHSAGRQMSAHMSDPERKILSLVGPVGNHALQAAGVAASIKHRHENPIVVCSMGDGTTQEGEVLEAIAEAVRSELPLLFWIEDNGYSISTRTRGKTLYSLPHWCERPTSFLGLPIHRINGREIGLFSAEIESVISHIRRTRRPALVVFEVDRLSNHTNSDDERDYRLPEEIERVRREGDPVRRLEKYLLKNGIDRQELDRVAAQVVEDVARAAELARGVSQPRSCTGAKRALSPSQASAPLEYTGNPDEPRLTMLEAVRGVLRHRMTEDPRISLFGEDIEDPKGDVFGVTKGLTLEFPGRVVNSALSESTIVGVSIGRALAGEKPVALIQFADFLPLAFNQIHSELGSMFWRTNGGWECPVIVMAPCGGYRPGLGPFHAQTLESIFAHVPGVDVFMPSCAGDAAGLLNAALDSGRPTIFLYPKSCLNDRTRMTSTDVGRHRVLPGSSRTVRRGDDLTIVTWGSTVPLCEQVCSSLESAGFRAELIDLRSISPWDSETVIRSARRTSKLLVVHEDNLTCGFGAEVVAAVAESAECPVTCRRVTRPDTYVPCNYSNQLEVLPSFGRILEGAAAMLGIEVSWEAIEDPSGDLFPIHAIGASPADQSVAVVAWTVGPGDLVARGQRIADLESDKSVYELSSPIDGRIVSVLVPVGESVSVGTALALLSTLGSDVRHSPARRGRSVEPRLRREPTAYVAGRRRALQASRAPTIAMSAAYVATGSARVTNDDLARLFPPRTPEEIWSHTGIRTRPHLADGESILSISVEATRLALRAEGLALRDIDAIICATTTPVFSTPSLACLILHALSEDEEPHEAAAFDISAACSGYLYALSCGFDYLSGRPASRVVVVTADALSQVSAAPDYLTAALFGDAASATILSVPSRDTPPWARLSRPVISAEGEPGDVLRVDTRGSGRVVIEGKQALQAAVPRMLRVLDRACYEAGVSPSDLDLVVPHQASNKLIDNFARRLPSENIEIFSNIENHGNCSSSSIPLCLSELSGRGKLPLYVGLAAFGGGYAYGAAVLTVGRDDDATAPPGSTRTVRPAASRREGLRMRPDVSSGDNGTVH